MLSENTKNILDKNLEIFKQNFADKFEEEIKGRADRRTNTFSSFHSSEAINSLGLDEFKKNLSKLWASRSWANKDWYFENTMKLNIKTFPNIKENIIKLCFFDAPIENRVNAFLEQTNGMSFGFISEILYLSSDSKFPIYNGTTKKLLKQLGINLKDRLPRGNKRNKGMIYKEFVSVYKEILEYVKSKNKMIDTFEKLDTLVWMTNYSDDSTTASSINQKQDDLTENFSILVVKMGARQKEKDFHTLRQIWKEQKVASFGFTELEAYDPKKYNKYDYEYLKKIMLNNNSSEGRIKKLAGYIRAFHNVRPGKDWVIAYFNSHLYGFGLVNSEYHINKHLGKDWKHAIGVDWVWLDKPIRLQEYSRELYRQAKHRSTVNIVNNSTAKKDFVAIVKKYSSKVFQDTAGLSDFKEYSSKDKAKEIGTDIQAQVGLQTIDKVAQETFLPKEKLAKIENSLLKSSKKQVIFDGVPGTGKTFVAEKLGEYLSHKEGKLIGGFEIISCHGGMSFEYLFQGLAPSKDGKLKSEKGIITNFAEKASENKDAFYVLVLDEINRTNIPQVFGQMLYLLEYRGKKVALPYNSESINLPENLLIIATMNSEDRSTGVLDFALRRRFSHFSFEPSDKVLQSWLEKQHYKNSEEVDIPQVVQLFKSLNKDLEEYDKHFQVGHSYFMTEYPLSDAGINRLWEHEIIPLLKERFFHEKNEVDKFDWKKLLEKLKKPEVSTKEETENKKAS